MQFVADEASTGSCDLVITGEASDDPAPFSSASYDVSSRARTSAAVSWSPEPWSVVGEASERQRTPDLSPVVQEIVDRPGYETRAGTGPSVELAVGQRRLDWGTHPRGADEGSAEP